MFFWVLTPCLDARCRHPFPSFDCHRRPAGMPGGLRSVIAELLLVKHQLRILNRGRKRAPNLRAAERFIAGLCTRFMNWASEWADHGLLRKSSD